MIMARLAMCLTACVSAAGFAQGTPPPPPIPSIPLAPVVTAPPTSQLVTWSADDVRCDGAPRSFARAPGTMPSMTYFFGPTSIRAVEYRFAIDETGRPTGIARVDKQYVQNSDDLAPSLAVSRFAGNAPATACTVRFAATVQPVATAPVPQAMAAFLFAPSQPPRALWDRIQPPGASCTEPAPIVLMRAFPPYDTLPRQVGRPSWSMIGFDIDAKGKPQRVHRVDGNGNAALDTASLKAVRDTRFAPGTPRMGCTFPYRLASEPMPAAAPPEEAAYRPAGSTCPPTTDWAVKPTLTYPPAYGRRSVEGWAMVAYDVAPWGEIGNVRVLRTEPSEDFGTQAMNVVRSARRAASDRGYTGCVDRVRFIMPASAHAAQNEPQPS